ncbi:DUF2249 domain-containing protein [Krasilnikovia sp. M28-CT-15]|uniref:DUF2249 domain-containing protein n=1 Tax=Krasilnikovia sp. M28-CT-15 TaxID=3373540 RepID=UPI0038762AB2
MSQPDRAANQRAADAVVRHHTQLATTLAGHVADLLHAAEFGALRHVWRRRNALAAWLHDELLPHAYAEEAALYPAAADEPEGKLLVEGMLGEHRALTALVDELEAATSPVVAAGAARALQALFIAHLAKENDLVVPLLISTGKVDLARLLDGMHDLIGGQAEPGTGGQAEPGTGGQAEPGTGGQAEPGTGGQAEPGTGGQAEPGTGGCGGACGCGGDAADAAQATAAVLTIDPRLDVRDLPHGERHARVLAELDTLPAHGALVLVAPHAPRPLLAEIDARYGGQMAAEWLQDGPDVWQIRLRRAPAVL